jgi:hypothetical protein
MEKRRTTTRVIRIPFLPGITVHLLKIFYSCFRESNLTPPYAARELALLSKHSPPKNVSNLYNMIPLLVNQFQKHAVCTSQFTVYNKNSGLWIYSLGFGLSLLFSVRGLTFDV